MKIIDIRCMRGPNVWSVRKNRLVVMKLDLEELEEMPTNRIEGFYDRLKMAMPSLQSHFCSEGHAGGFFERVKDGTWMGHVVEHIALELQSLADMDCGFGRTRGTGAYGVYHVVFEYAEESAGELAARKAVDMASALIAGKPFNVTEVVQQLKSIYQTNRLGPSTQSIVDACKARNIPAIRLNDESYVQLGYGSRQRRIEATTTDGTGNIAVSLAGNKNATKVLLGKAGVPVPAGVTVTSEEELFQAIAEIGYPIVVKPLDANQGKGVTTDLRDMHAVIEAYNWASLFSDDVIVEKFVTGNDYRLLVIGDTFRAAAKRTPAMVFGDGISTIHELINQTNLDPRRGDGHENKLTRIVVDDMLRGHLGGQNLTLQTVLPSDVSVTVSDAANLSKGGTSDDVTDHVHPEIVLMAVRVAKLIGLDICGIDVIAQDVTKPLKTSGISVIEVNASPGFRMHLYPSSGKPRNVGEDVAEMLFPNQAAGRIPVIAITGTNGKTTTTRITAHLMKQGGACVGYTTTDGIYVNDVMIEEGDCTGPASARTILTDPTVDVAVLETARGGLLRSGLAFDQCDVGIVTNVAADHLGLNDIHTVEQMVRVKATVAESVRPDGFAILNADNDESYGIRERVKCQIGLFSMDPDSERVLSHTRDGGLACIYEQGEIRLVNGSIKVTVADAQAIPATFDGKCLFMIENILGAVLAAYSQGVDINLLAKGLYSFQISDETTPGRLNHFHFRNFDLLVDYAHNPHGMSALGQYLGNVPATSKLGIITGVGDRRDEDIRELGKVVAGIFDEVIIRLDEDLRGRKHQEIIELVRHGIKAVNPFCKINVIQDELQALNYAIRHSRPGQLIVLTTDKIKNAISHIKRIQEQEEKGVVAQPQLALY
ncbi:cyanophycin synthetase [Dyadobacter sp. CY323]|uniref:cyanophycin synthetase n=1 Tax=Dyadobacter sp. CY323 TaxID=2907302 RepID=UPI001F3081E7|nr:cyanophycin synthetase [Dyadobacter sp. CY323]MCE6991226.1 cyanophycin synthetase [Dyadobacter sp. CY323]